MNITFKALSESHLPLLLKWLETDHVKLWWDQDIKWTLELIQDKYSHYIKRYKRLQLADQVIEKPMYSYVIYADNKPIGYVQYYDKHDFPPKQGYDTSELPQSCAGLDYYIGEVDFIGKGIGSKTLERFIEFYVAQKFDYVFVDPDTGNNNAISSYKNVGFTIIKRINDCNTTFMLKKLEIQNLFVLVVTYIATAEALEEYREEHTHFVSTCYDNGVFITSGPQIPKLGGIAIAKSKNKKELRAIVSKDPFAMHNLAEYQIIEFKPRRQICAL